jgi:cell division protein FtsL
MGLILLHGLVLSATSSTVVIITTQATQVVVAVENAETESVARENDSKPTY